MSNLPKASRKEKTESFLKIRGIKINLALPNIESEEDTIIRTPQEIARRVTILATTNLVAFNVLSGEEASGYLQEHNLWEFITPKEIDFLNDPTEEKKNYESWKCEGIWTLLWVLKIVDDLGFPDEMCDLNNVPPEKYPIGEDKDPNDFINAIKSVRSKSEILDANDLYYRIDWACVDARLNQTKMEMVHPGVVYERHYALNWLINYMGQEWDDITCDT